jgi:DNA-binding MarR family transcriptional regulator
LTQSFGSPNLPPVTLPASPPMAATSVGDAAAAPLEPPTPDALLRRDLGGRLARTLARQRGDYVSCLVRDGVSTAQMWVLMKLRLHGDLSMSGLAELLGLGLPNVTGIVDRLEERGLVERRRDVRDRRIVHVSLTEAGSRIPDGMEGLQRDVLGRVLQAMDREMLERCLAVVDEVDAEAGPVPADRRCSGLTARQRGA